MLQQKVRPFIDREDLIAPGTRVLVGLSGGVDSVVLLHLLTRMGYRTEAAHVNYRLRGAASDADEAFARDLCQRLGVPLHVAAFDTEAHAREHGQTIQEAARELRYDYFARLAEQEGVRAVAVAHHLDDQAETVLLNLLRGAGPEGLAGMPARRALTPGGNALLVRPLLHVRRVDIEAYARAEGLAWREDASNLSPKYRRGVLRSAVLPLLEEHFGPAAAANIARSAALLRAYVEDTLRPELAAHFEQAAHEEPPGGRLDLDALRALPAVWRGRLVLEALRRWLPDAPRSAALVGAVVGLIEAQAGRRVALRDGTVWRERAGLFFAPKQASEADDGAALAPGDAVEAGRGLLRVELLAARPARLDADAPEAVVADADRLAFPLTARRWRPGDRFRPLGMQGAKKVSDFLTDEKVPPHRRAETLVLLSGDEIVWVVGRRLAHGVRVRPGTRRFAKFTYIQNDEHARSRRAPTNRPPGRVP